MAKLNPYLAFDGNAREAMEFYRDVFGGDLTVTTFGEYGDAPNPDGVMHAQLETDLGFTLMASDPAPGTQVATGGGMQVSLSGDEVDTLRGYWKRLADGGQVTVPLEPQMWGDEFGMCIDRFGTPWLVNITVPKG
jgi:PhnB protein